MPEKILLIDAGTGNLQSVKKALENLGAVVTLTDQPEILESADKLVLPGVGAFGDFMHGLRTRQLVDPITRLVEDGTPLLGICVGMQALFEIGEEGGVHRGLGLLAGRVVHFPPFPNLKIPHTGWNQLESCAASPLLARIQPGDYAYFNHAYYCAPADHLDIVATTEYGISFASAVQRRNLFGVQFHPEKSQQVGLQILRNFLSLQV